MYNWNCTEIVVHSSHSFYIVSVLVLAILISVSIFIVLICISMTACHWVVFMLYLLDIGYLLHIHILFSEVSVKGFVPFHN